MGISRINDYSLAFASYKLQQIPSISVDDVNKQNTVSNEAPVSDAPKDDLAINEVRKQGNISVKDVSLTFNQKDDFGYIGKDSAIEDLDMEKAISDMKKDQVLQQYQYFVGRNDSLTASDDNDGLVVMKF